MNFITKSSFFLLLTVFTFGSCKDDSKNFGEEEDGYAYDFTDVINTYVNDVIIRTYTNMRDCATTLYEAVEIYQADQSQENLNDVCAKWRAMRIPWEQSEGFLFGPAALLNLDPSLDSWPLDKNGIDLVLTGTANIDKDRITSPNLHGFHAIEYLIFSAGNPKTQALSAREVDYLVVATEYLRNDTYELWANWVGKDAITDEVAEALEDAEIGIKYNFSSQFKNAGKAGSSFLTQNDAIDQIIDGCVDIASEVGAQKIGGPYSTAKTNLSQAVLEVESWYSYNSLGDYENNIISIRNSYFGGKNKTAGNASANSISAFVRSKNTELDNEITNAIEAAYNAIHTITPKPFRDAIAIQPNQSIQAAMDACSDLETIFEKIKTLRN